MELRRRIWPSGWRAIVLLLVGSLMGASLIAPAVAHVAGWDHNWKIHIRPKADARYERKPVRTVLSYAGTDSDNTISFTYEELRVVGSFTKKRAGSVVQLTWVGHARHEGTDPNSFCDFQLRIDDSPDASSAGRAVLYGTDTPVSVTTLFGGLGTGSHEVSIWVRGWGIAPTPTCTINRGNFAQTVIVEEVDPTAPGGTLSTSTPAGSSTGGMKNGAPR